MKKTVKKVSPAKKASPTKKKAPDRILELAQVAYKAMVDTKAEDAVALDVRTIASFTDYLLIASGTNPRQIVAMSERIDDAVKKALGRNPLNREGLETAQWVILDYGDIVCHLFTQEAREFYALEKLWHDAKIVKMTKSKTKK